MTENTSDRRPLYGPQPEIVAVVGSDLSIGRDGDLIRHLPEDLRHFKALTTGGTVVMGRKTWESLPRRPLPGRLNIVVTRNADYRPLTAKGMEPDPETTLIADSLERALQMAADIAPDRRLFIIGGGQIYRQAMPMCTVLHLTEIAEDCPEADTFFPAVDPEMWQRTDTEPGTEGNYNFVTYRRR